MCGKLIRKYPTSSNVRFLDFAKPDVERPDGKPVWKGVTSSSASEAEAIFKTPSFYDITAECGNVVTEYV